MLKHLRAWQICHRNAFVRGMNKLTCTPLATTMILAVISVALTLPMLLWVLTDNVKQSSSDWQKSNHISLYLDVDLSPSEQTNVLLRVRQTPGVYQATLTTPAEGLMALQKQEGLSDVAQYLSTNPLPAMIDITPDEAISSAEKMTSLSQKLQSYPHVEQASLDAQWTTRLYAIFSFAVTLTHTLMILLGFAVIMIVGNTLRFSVSQACEEIRILKLIGATDAFVARPFLYTGVLYGILGAIGALLLVKLFLLRLAPLCQQLFAAYYISDVLWRISFMQMLVLFVSATGLSFLGSMLSVRRQIATIES